MARILIVDDEDVYRRQLQVALAADGHEVITAGRGREAIDIGTRLQPDLLVTDWMLQNHIHGVHVIEVLRAVFPNMGAIMITGFPSQELRNSADSVHVADFIEKPFDLGRLRSSVYSALAAESNATRQAAMRVIAVNHDGHIVYANQAARTLFSQLQSADRTRHLSDLFGSENLPDLDQASERWVAVSPLTPEPTTWYLHAQPADNDGIRLLVLRTGPRDRHVQHALVEMLLGFQEERAVRWPYAARVLVIENDPLVRSAFVAMFEHVGAGCYAAASLTDALPLLESDAGLRYVILDDELAGKQAETWVTRMRAARPNAVIVGTSSYGYRETFAHTGVDHFIQKPWRVSDLLDVLQGRIRACEECGSSLPLRRCKANEPPEHWCCTACGAQYEGVLDGDADPALKDHVCQLDL